MSIAEESPAEKLVNHNNRRERFLKLTGIFLLVGAGAILYLTFAPSLEEEIRYRLSTDNTPKPVFSRQEAERAGVQTENALLPIDEDFGIVIPKIAANARVIPNVEWHNPDVYQRALTRGVAHALGTSLPGQSGNIFIFAHSGVDFYEAARYNAEFYLIKKLETADEIDLFYEGRKYPYEVKEKRIVSPEETEYLTGDLYESRLTLMTCWPPGTTLKRLIVQAYPKGE